MSLIDILRELKKLTFNCGLNLHKVSEHKVKDLLTWLIQYKEIDLIDEEAVKKQIKSYYNEIKQILINMKKDLENLEIRNKT